MCSLGVLSECSLNVFPEYYLGGLHVFSGCSVFSECSWGMFSECSLGVISDLAL